MMNPRPPDAPLPPWFALAAIAVASALPPAPRAEARTLDRRHAVEAALQQNPQVASARAEEMAVQAQRRQVDAARWPIVELDAGIGPSDVANLVPGTAVQSRQEQYHNLHWSDLSAVFIGNLTVTQPLYTFGKIARRQEATDHGLRARQAQTRMQKADVAFDVAQIYEGYLLARDGERFFDEVIHWLDSTLQSTQDKLANNVAAVTERDVLRIQSAVALAQLGLHRAQAGQAQAHDGLTAYLGLPRDEPLTFAEPELAPVGELPEGFASLVTLAADNRPELTALGEGWRAIDALARAEAAGFAPDIFVMAFVLAAYTPGRDWIETRFVVDPVNHFIPGALVGLRWQFQGDMAQARAQEQRARADVLRHLGEWANGGIPAEVRRAYEDVRRTDKDIADGEPAIQKAKRWMVQAGADYSVGLLDLREVSDAVEAYVTLRTAVLMARFDHNVAMAALARATGTLDSAQPLFYLSPPAVEGSRPAATGTAAPGPAAPGPGAP